jgi:hypothetical protein
MGLSDKIFASVYEVIWLQLYQFSRYTHKMVHYLSLKGDSFTIWTFQEVWVYEFLNIFEYRCCSYHSLGLFPASKLLFLIQIKFYLIFYNYYDYDGNYSSTYFNSRMEVWLNWFNNSDFIDQKYLLHFEAPKLDYPFRFAEKSFLKTLLWDLWYEYLVFVTSGIIWQTSDRVFVSDRFSQTLADYFNFL